MAIVNFNSVSGVSTISATSSVTVGTGLTITTGGIVGITSINNGPIGGSKNMVINGEMVIDQRNAGSAVTINSDGFGGRLFPVDRFPVQRVGTIVITAQQDTVAPPDFQNSVKLTVTTADSSVAATDYAFINHRLEGYTASPLRYGTSAAKEATLSFWVRSSITGTYCISISNYADNRSHVKEYTINSANTWEYKTITITGDTTGTWEKTNSGGMNISWTLLSGSDYQNTANTWHSAVELATSNQTQWGSTTSATFYLTGVQLELGNTASVFERRSYGDELMRCKRYFQKSYNATDVPGTATSNGTEWLTLPTSGRIAMTTRLRVPMRTNCTVKLYDWAGNIDRVRTSGGNNQTTFTIQVANETAFTVDTTSTNVTELLYQYTAAAEL